MPTHTVTDWLLEESNPSLRYRTLIELLHESPRSRMVREAKGVLVDSPAVKDLFVRMHSDGYWLETNPRTGITVGDGVEYGSYAGNPFCLSYLAELGLDRSHPLVAKAADRYLSLQKSDGDFWDHFSCLNGYNIRNFILLGYREDPRLQKTISLMLATRRPDGGYLCDMHEKRRPNRRSCIRGCSKMLMAYALLPDLWKHERCRELVDYFLRRNCIFKLRKPHEFVRADIIRTQFPIIWQTSALEILWSLSRMGLGRHPATQATWEALEAKRTDDGRYVMDWTPTQSLLKAGKRGQPNKWVTFYALQAVQYRNATSTEL
ncbi:MAG: hypothetical protein EOM20_07385 [Spartobacteria bacterium]|nr:hypothetical protein [Spartobacteria bacterium]